MAVTAVGFDLDHTLAVTERERRTLLAEAVDEVDAPPLEREEYLAAHGEHLTGETRTPIFEALLADRESDADPEALAAAYRRRVGDALVALPGVEGMLADLRRRYRVGLLTNGPTVAQRAKLATLGWRDAFDVTLVTGGLPAGKPDARAFEALLDALDVAAAETVYVGDDVTADVGGAHEAGLQAVQVVYPGGPDPDPRAVAHVDRRDLTDTLPEVLADL